MVSHLQPDILECEVKWALGSITMSKDSGGDGISAELFQILKMMLLKCALSMSANLENSVVAGLEKDSFHTNCKEGNAKEYSNYRQMCSFSMLGRLCSRSFKLGFSST